MPNYCSCDLYFDGPEPDTVAFMALVGAPSGFDFGAVIQPAYIDSRDNRRDVWGTSSVAWHPEWRGGVVAFETAWAPPLGVVAALHKRFPRMSFSLEYFEMGMGFCGGVVYDSEEDHDDEWEPGKPAREWHCTEYRGRRGG